MDDLWHQREVRRSRVARSIEGCRAMAVEAKRRGLQPVLSGPRAGPIQNLAAELGLSAQIFDLGDAPSSTAALADIAIVAHCAGPFASTSAPMIDACLKSRTHYVDIRGEIEVFLAAQRRHADAKAAGIVICPGVGFDVIPTDCIRSAAADSFPTFTASEWRIATNSGCCRQEHRRDDRVCLW